MIGILGLIGVRVPFSAHGVVILERSVLRVRVGMLLEVIAHLFFLAVLVAMFASLFADSAIAMLMP